MPLVSVVMAAYNAERFVAEAIASVRAQTCTDWELIVVNDGSKDRTGLIAEREAMSDRRVRVVHQANSGRPGTARNHGLSLARGAFVGFLDADDLYAPTRLELCIRALRRNADCGMVFHDFRAIDENGAVLRPAVLAEQGFLKCDRVRSLRVDGDSLRLDDSLIAFLMTDYVACWTGAVLLANASHRHGPLRFNEDLVIAEDLDLWLRVLESSNAIYVEMPLSSYRRHGHGISNRRIVLLEDTIKVLESHRNRVSLDRAGSFDRLFSSRLRRLHAELAYHHLIGDHRRAARKWYARGFCQYGGGENALGFLKSCLPWAAMRDLWYRRLEARGGS